MFKRLGELAARRFLWVIVGWFALAGILMATAPRLGDVVTFDVSAFLAHDAQSIRAVDLLAKTWPDDDVGDSAAIIFSRPTGLLASDFAYLDAVESWLRSEEAPGVVRSTQSGRSRPELASVLASIDGTTTIMLVQFVTPPFEPPTNKAIQAIRAHVSRTKPDGLAVYASGNAGVAADQATTIDTSVKRTTAVTLVLVILILLWVYRSPVTLLVPLVTIGLALSVSQGIIALLADHGMRVSSLVETFMVVIIFGAGTDYCLFVISRFREDVAHSHEYRRTLVATIAIVGAVIASSASTVIVGFTAQGVAKFGMFRTTGPAMAIAVAVTLVAGLTLTPALMRVFGRSLFWPAHPEKLAAEGALPELRVAVAGADAPAPRASPTAGDQTRRTRATRGKGSRT